MLKKRLIFSLFIVLILLGFSGKWLVDNNKPIGSIVPDKVKSSFINNENKEIVSLKESETKNFSVMHISEDYDKPLSIEEIKQEVSYLEETQVIAQLEKVKSQIYDQDLVDKLNRDLLDTEDQAKAQEIFARAFVLGIKNTENKLSKIVPAMMNDIEKQMESIKKARQLLNDEDFY